MADLTPQEIQDITNSYIAADNGKALNIYFEDCWFLDYFLKQKKGLFETADGGKDIEVPLIYDGAESGFYLRNEVLPQNERENITVVNFGWKHAYASTAVMRSDIKKASTTKAAVKLITTKVQTVMAEASKNLAENIYTENGDSSSGLTGLLTCCNETTTTDYGGKAEDDIVAADGTKPWEGKRITTSQAISLTNIRTARTTGNIKSGASGKPNLMATTESLYNTLSGILQVQQRFTSDSKTAEAGFENLMVEGMMVTTDYRVPSSTAFFLNSKHVGFAVMKGSNFDRQPWEPLKNNAKGQYMEILWDGNLIVNNRKAHVAHTGFSS